MMRLVIVILFIILIINFNDIIARRIQTNNIDFNCIKSLQEELNFDKNLHISVCKHVILESSPLISDRNSPITFRVKIRAYSFAIELTLRRKHSPGFTFTSVLFENVDKGEIKHTRTNISAITKSSQLTYYSDTQKNAAMIKFVENGLATMEGIIGNYVLRFVPKANYYILFRISFHPVPIYNENFNFYKVVDDVPSYDLKTTIGNVDIKLLVALDEYSITGRFISQVIKGLLIHFNAADMLFSKFTNPKITLSIIGIILPYATRNGIYNTTFNNNKVRNLRTTQIKESNEFFISKRSDYSLNSYHIGVVMTTLPICESKSKNCEIYVSGYQNYDCPHQRNAYSKTTIIRHPDFYGNYGAIVQNLKTRFIKYIARRYDKVGEILNPDEAFTAWSQNDVDNLTYYFRSQTARCWNEKLNVTPRPRNNARRSDRKENITNGWKWTSRPGVSGVQTNDVSNRTGISTIPLKEGRNEEKVNSSKGSTLKDLTKVNESRVTGREHNTSLPLQKTDQSKIPIPVTEFSSARIIPEDYNNKGSKVLNETVTVAPRVKPYDITERPQKSAMKSPEEKNKAEIPPFNDYIPNDRNQMRNRSTTNRESTNNIPLQKTDKSTTQAPVTESTKLGFTANDHKIIGSQKVNNTLTAVSREELDNLSEKPKESRTRSPEAKNKVIMPSPNYLLSKDQIKVTNSTTSGLEHETNLRLQGTEKSTNRAPLTESTTKRFTSNDHRNKDFQKVNNTASIASELEFDDKSMKDEKSTILSPEGKNRKKIPFAEKTIPKDWIKAMNSHTTGHKPDTNLSPRGIHQSTNLASSEESPPARPIPQNYNIEGFKVMNETATAASEVNSDEMSKALETSTTRLPERVTKAEDLSLKNSNPNGQNQTTNSSATGHEPATNHSSQGTLQSTTLASSTESTTAQQTIRNKTIEGFNLLNKTTTVASGEETDDMSQTRKTSTTSLPEKNTKAKDASIRNLGPNVQNQTTNDSATGYKLRANYSSQKTFQSTTLASSVESTTTQLTLHDNDVVGFNLQNKTTKVAFKGGPENMSEKPEESTTPLPKRKKKPEVSPSNDSNPNVHNKTTNISVNGRKPDTNHLPQNTLQSTTVTPSTDSTTRRLTTLKNNTVGIKVLKETATVTSEVKPGEMSEAMETSTTQLPEKYTEAGDLSMKNANSNGQNQTNNSNVSVLEPADSHASQGNLHLTTLASSTESTTEHSTPIKNNSVGTNILSKAATAASEVRTDKMSEAPKTSTLPLPEIRTKAKDLSLKNSNTNDPKQTTNNNANDLKPADNHSSQGTLKSTTLASSMKSTTGQPTPQRNSTGGTTVLNKTAIVASEVKPDKMSKAVGTSASPLKKKDTAAQDLSLKNSNLNGQNRTTNSNETSHELNKNYLARGTLQLTTLAFSTKSTTTQRTTRAIDSEDIYVLNNIPPDASEVRPKELSETLETSTTLLPEVKTKATDLFLKNSNLNGQNQITNSSAAEHDLNANYSSNNSLQLTNLASATELTITRNTTQNHTSGNIARTVLNKITTVGSQVKREEMTETLKTSASPLLGKNTKAKDLSLKNLNLNDPNHITNSSVKVHEPGSNHSLQGPLPSTTPVSSTESTTTQSSTQNNNNGEAKVLPGTATLPSGAIPNEIAEVHGTSAFPLTEKNTKAKDLSLKNLNLNDQNHITNNSVNVHEPGFNHSLQGPLPSTTPASATQSTSTKNSTQINNNGEAKVLPGTTTLSSRANPNVIAEALGTPASPLTEKNTKAKDLSLKNLNLNDQNHITHNSVNVHEPGSNNSLQGLLPSTTPASTTESTTTQSSTQDNKSEGAKVLDETATLPSGAIPNEIAEVHGTSAFPLTEKNTKAKDLSLKNLNFNDQNHITNSSVNVHEPGSNNSLQGLLPSTTPASTTESTTTQSSTQNNNNGEAKVLPGTATLPSGANPNEIAEALGTPSTPLPEKNTKAKDLSLKNLNLNDQNHITNNSVNVHEPDSNNSLQGLLPSTTPASTTESTTTQSSTQDNKSEGAKVLDETATLPSGAIPNEIAEVHGTSAFPLTEKNTKAKDLSMRNFNSRDQNHITNSSVNVHEPGSNHSLQGPLPSTTPASTTESTTTQSSTQNNNNGEAKVLPETATLPSGANPNEIAEALGTPSTPLPEKNTKAKDLSLKNLNLNDQNHITNNSVNVHEPGSNNSLQGLLPSTTPASTTESTTTQSSTQDNKSEGAKVLDETATLPSGAIPNEIAEVHGTSAFPLTEKNTKAKDLSSKNLNFNDQNHITNSSVNVHEPGSNNSLQGLLPSTTPASTTESTTTQSSTQDNKSEGAKVLDETATLPSGAIPNEIAEVHGTSAFPLTEKNTKAKDLSSKNLNFNDQNHITNSSVNVHEPGSNHSLQGPLPSTTPASTTESTTTQSSTQNNNNGEAKVLPGTATLPSGAIPNEIAEVHGTSAFPLTEKNTKAKILSLKNLNFNDQNHITNSSVNVREPDPNHSLQGPLPSTTPVSSTESTTTQNSTQNNNNGEAKVLPGTTTLSSGANPNVIAEALGTPASPLPEKNTKAKDLSLKNLNLNDQNHITNSSVNVHEPGSNHSLQGPLRSTTPVSSTESTTTQNSTQDNKSEGAKVLDETATLPSGAIRNEIAEVHGTSAFPLTEKNTKAKDLSMRNFNSRDQNHITNSSVNVHEPGSNHSLQGLLPSTTPASSTESTTTQNSTQNNNNGGDKVLPGTATLPSGANPNEIAEALGTPASPLPEKNTKAKDLSLKNLNLNDQNHITNSSVNVHEPDSNHSLQGPLPSTTPASSTKSTTTQNSTQNNNNGEAKVLPGTATISSGANLNVIAEALRTPASPLPEKNTKAKDFSFRNFNSNDQNHITNSSVNVYEPGSNHSLQGLLPSTTPISTTESTTTQSLTQNNNNGEAKVLPGTATISSGANPNVIAEALRTPASPLPEKNTKAKDLSFRNFNSNDQNHITNSSVNVYEPGSNHSLQGLLPSTTPISTTESTTTQSLTQNNNNGEAKVLPGTATLPSGAKPNVIAKALGTLSSPLPEKHTKAKDLSLKNLNLNDQNHITSSSANVHEPGSNHSLQGPLPLATPASSTESTTRQNSTQNNNNREAKALPGIATLPSGANSNVIAEALGTPVSPLPEKNTKAKDLALKNLNLNDQNHIIKSSANVHEPGTNHLKLDTYQVTSLASSTESTTTRPKFQEHKIGGSTALNKAALVESRVKPDDMFKTLETSTTPVPQKQTKVEDPFLKNLNSFVQTPKKNSSATGRQPDPNLLLSESNHSSIRASVTESATALFTANDHEIIGFYKENDTFTVASGVDSNDLSTRPEKSTTLLSQLQNNAEKHSIDNPILKDRTDVNNSHTTGRKPDINFPSRNTDESTSRAPVTEFTTPVFVNFLPEELEKLIDTPNPDNTSYKQLLFNPEISNGLESTVDISPLVESTTVTLKSAAVADSSDSSAFILYASLSVPLSLSIVYSSYLFFNACRRIRRST